MMSILNNSLDANAGEVLLLPSPSLPKLKEHRRSNFETFIPIKCLDVPRNVINLAGKIEVPHLSLGSQHCGTSQDSSRFSVSEVGDGTSYGTSMSVDPSVTSPDRVMQQLLIADSHGTMASNLIRDLHQEIAAYQKCDSLTEAQSQLLRERKFKLDQSIAEFESITTEVKRLANGQNPRIPRDEKEKLATTPLSSSRKEMKEDPLSCQTSTCSSPRSPTREPSTRLRTQLDSIMSRIKTTIADCNLSPDGSLADSDLSHRSELPNNEGESGDTAVTTPRKNGEKDAEVSKVLLQQITSENEALEADRYHLQEMVLSKENEVDVMQRALESQELKLRLLQQENTSIRERLNENTSAERPSQKEVGLQQEDLNWLEGELTRMKAELHQLQTGRQELLLDLQLTRFSLIGEELEKNEVPSQNKIAEIVQLDTVDQSDDTNHDSPALATAEPEVTHDLTTTAGPAYSLDLSSGDGNSLAHNVVVNVMQAISVQPSIGTLLSNNNGPKDCLESKPDSVKEKKDDDYVDIEHGDWEASSIALYKEEERKNSRVNSKDVRIGDSKEVDASSNKATTFLGILCEALTELTPSELESKEELEDCRKDKLGGDTQGEEREAFYSGRESFYSGREDMSNCSDEIRSEEDESGAEAEAEPIREDAVNNQVRLQVPKGSQTESEPTTDDVDDLRAALAERRNILSDYRNKFMSAQERVEELRRELDGKDEELSRIQEESLQEIRVVKEQFVCKMNSIQTLPLLLQEMQEKLKDNVKMRMMAERTVQQLKTDTDKLSEMNAALQLEVEKGRTSLDTSKQSRRQLNAELDRLSKELSQKAEDDSQLRMLKEEILQQEKEKAELTKKLNDLRNESETVRADAARQLKRMEERAEASRRAMQENIADLEQHIIVERVNVKMAAKEKEEIRCKLEAKIENLNRTLGESQAMWLKLQGTLGVLQNSMTVDDIATPISLLQGINASLQDSNPTEITEKELSVNLNEETQFKFQTRTSDLNSNTDSEKIKKIRGRFLKKRRSIRGMLLAGRNTLLESKKGKAVSGEDGCNQEKQETNTAIMRSKTEKPNHDGPPQQTDSTDSANSDVIKEKDNSKDHIEEKVKARTVEPKKNYQFSKPLWIKVTDGHCENENLGSQRERRHNNYFGQFENYSNIDEMSMAHRQSQTRLSHKMHKDDTCLHYSREYREKKNHFQTNQPERIHRHNYSNSKIFEEERSRSEINIGIEVMRQADDAEKVRCRPKDGCCKNQKICREMNPSPYCPEPSSQENVSTRSKRNKKKCKNSRRGQSQRHLNGGDGEVKGNFVEGCKHVEHSSYDYMPKGNGGKVLPGE